MPDLTVARLRDAAATQRLLVTRYGLAAKRAFDHAELDGYAFRLEHEQNHAHKGDEPMSDLTPENLRGAAELVNMAQAVFGKIEDGASPGLTLFMWADRLEREQAAEARREKRAEEIAAEYEHIVYGTPREIDPSKGSIRIARALMDRYPALVDGPGE